MHLGTKNSGFFFILYRCLSSIFKLLIKSQVWVGFLLSLFAFFFSKYFFMLTDIFISLFVFLAAWIIYVADRMMPSKEDKQDGRNIQRLIVRQKGLFLTLMALDILFVVSSVFWTHKRYALGWFIGLVLSFFYIIRIPLIQKRIKDIPYIKVFYVPVVYLSTTWMMIPGPSIEPFFRGDFYLLCLFLIVLVSIFDIKDAQADRIAGIRTFANSVSKTVFITTIFVLGLVGLSLSVVFEYKLMAICFAVLSLAILALYKCSEKRWLYFTVYDSLVALPGVVLLFYS